MGPGLSCLRLDKGNGEICEQGKQVPHDPKGRRERQRIQWGQTRLIAGGHAIGRTGEMSGLGFNRNRQDLDWLEDVHMGYEEGRPADFDRGQQPQRLGDGPSDLDMLAREFLIKFQMAPKHPMVELSQAYRKF